MKVYFSLFVISFAIILFPVSDHENDISGVYVSKNPTFGEKTAIMYSQGYMNFLFLGVKDETLELRPDNTFTRTLNACKRGPVSDTGKWKKSGKTIILDFDTPEHENQSFTIYKKARLYMVADMDIGEGETMPHLTLLEKQ